ncbi:MAG: DUF167 domain-containing protein [Armatimonadetes bacterium]|nr:DUF167 domain-containing protein [Armatimonadota bacterium]
MKSAEESGIIELRLTPRAAENRISDFREGVLYVRVTAAPVDGEANRAMIELLSRCLEINKSSIEIVGGASARHKRLRVNGLSGKLINERLIRSLVKSRSDS